MLALAQAGERDAIDGVAVVGEESAGLFPFPPPGRGAVDDDVSIFFRGIGGARLRGNDQSDAKANRGGQGGKVSSFHIRE